jgi:hypothetical protein
MIQIILHGPIDKKESEHGKERKYGLQRDEEASEYKKIDDKDILISNLKFLSFIDLIDLILMEIQFIPR